ncbi:response regulator transcription factor [Streptomonospora nanhaiensis]|uniref:DNA-binding response OmpR family regulator n=1 Tax=Streptomonospora nanhaiensis TaxID=1323731 RepID=A0A853BTS6_9ACTN|nr:response regulator transcription factor [Streptomonospora nanhaiensis]MBV2363683.1 response regulator transcription factor [Streptomonospora nanhaiensis]MBX9387727.1 response regulator transcription factor [Streptomonospora nanhaiensis]NYI98728.1 DNA-binding response OmpR family regulator [Streptomonospora nanhaiensis]
MCAHVLIAEDDVQQADLVRRYLEREDHTTAVVHDGGAALAEYRRSRPDLVVLDVMLPEMSGLEVCRRLRAESDVAVLMLTARSTEDDLLAGLDIGADDYVTKPYSPRELMARIRTLLRRAAAPGGPDRPLRAGAVVVDPARHTVHVDGAQVECTPAEFQLLAALAARPEQVFTRSQLLERIHGIDRFFTERTIDVHVKNLRKKLEPNPRSPRRLVTVYGVGYKLRGGGETPA